MTTGAGWASKGPSGVWRERDLADVERPARYVGGEFGAAISCGWDRPLVVLAHPELYELGAGRLPVRQLHAWLAAQPGARVERVFLPAPDRRAALRARGQPLRTLESDSPLARAALVLLLIDHPLQALQAVQLLDAAGLEPLADDREAGSPAVIGLGLGAIPSGAWGGLFDGSVPNTALAQLARVLPRWQEAVESRGEVARSGAPATTPPPPPATAWPVPHLLPRPTDGPDRPPWCLPGMDPLAPYGVLAALTELLGGSVFSGSDGDPELMPPSWAWVPDASMARLLDEVAARSAGGADGPALARRVAELWHREARVGLGTRGTEFEDVEARERLAALVAPGRRRLPVDVAYGLPGETDDDLRRLAGRIAAVRDAWTAAGGSPAQLEVTLRVEAWPWGDPVPAPPAEQELERRARLLREESPSSLRMRRRSIARSRREALLLRAGPPATRALVSAARQVEALGWAEPELTLRAIEQELEAHGLDLESTLAGSTAAAIAPPTSAPADADGLRRRPGSRSRAGGPPPDADTESELRRSYRLRFARFGPARWLGHLDVMRALEQGLLRSGALAGGSGEPLRLSASPALAVGVASRAEYLDVEAPEGFAVGWEPAAAGPFLCRGMALLAAVPLPPRARDIQDAVRRARYRARIGGLGVGEVAEAVRRFRARDEVLVARRRKGREQLVNVRPLVAEIAVGPAGILEFTVKVSPSGSARPNEVVEAVVGPRAAEPFSVVRTEQLAHIGGRWASPLLAARRTRHLAVD